MKVFGKAGHAVASVLACYGLVSVLGGSFCAVSVCTEDCDPCLVQCKCNTCDHSPPLGPENSPRLSFYRLSIADDAAGGVVRRISDIAGLSLALTDGHEHGAADFRRFAESVIEFNGLLLQPRRGTWTPRPVEVFDATVVVPFANGSGATLAFLFDRRGHLIEIDEVRCAPEIGPDPR